MKQLYLKQLYANENRLPSYFHRLSPEVADELKMSIRKSKIIIDFFMTPASLDDVTDVIADVAV